MVGFLVFLAAPFFSSTTIPRRLDDNISPRTKWHSTIVMQLRPCDVQRPLADAECLLVYSELFDDLVGRLSTDTAIYGVRTFSYRHTTSSSALEIPPASSMGPVLLNEGPCIEILPLGLFHTDLGTHGTSLVAL